MLQDFIYNLNYIFNDLNLVHLLYKYYNTIKNLSYIYELLDIIFDKILKKEIIEDEFIQNFDIWNFIHNKIFNIIHNEMKINCCATMRNALLYSIHMSVNINYNYKINDPHNDQYYNILNYKDKYDVFIGLSEKYVSIYFDDVVEQTKIYNKIIKKIIELKLFNFEV